MPVLNRIADVQDEIAAWRHDLHAHPELQYDVHRTAGIVADKLRLFGCDQVVTGIGRTGVVGVIRGKSDTANRVLALRADMDALPITEANSFSYKSTNQGRMHACGHDGHTAMLLGAAKLLAESRNFDGSVAVIFQPAEEGGGGARAMVQDGLMERFGIQEVYGMHNVPGIPIGSFAIRPGPLMAAADQFSIEIAGTGAHAALPHQGVDPILVGSHVVTALQSIASRTVDPLEAAVVSVTIFKAGTTHNVIPQTASLTGTARTLSATTRDLVEARIRAIAEGTAAMMGAHASVSYRRGYPVTVNDTERTQFAAQIAGEVAGASAVDPAVAPMMGAEDFSYMLEQRPGAMIFLGNGDSASLHHPSYDFDDRAIAYGTSYWVRLVENGLPA